jgi:phenylacetate-CoA ligase
MSTWTCSLRFSLRSLVREAFCNVWARTFVYPRLAANERSIDKLRAYVAERAGRIGVPIAGDGTVLARLASPAGLLTKAEVRRHPEKLVRPRRAGSWIRTIIKTSGTSGSPLTIVQSMGNVVREAGFVYRQLRWIGYRHGQRRAWIRGDVVFVEHPTAGRFWCRDWVGNMLVMSSYHLSNATIGAYIAELERFDPVVIHAYPSSIAALAGWLKAAGRIYKGKALRGVMTSSETLDSDVRANVEETFGVRVFDWYGQAERVAAIGTCEHGSYHVLTDYGNAALLVSNPESCELVGTTLNNAAMPLVRYRTGDAVVPHPPGHDACPCGRVFPTIQGIIGRQEKIITLPDGRIVARLDRIFQHNAHLVEGQVLYRGNGNFVLRVVAADNFTDADGQAFVEQFLLRVPGVNVSVDRVGAIPRGPNGKFEFIAVAPEGPDVSPRP